MVLDTVYYVNSLNLVTIGPSVYSSGLILYFPRLLVAWNICHPSFIYTELSNQSYLVY